MNKYDDIINLPHHVSKNRKQMSLSDRAAQFAPFAALTGHYESIEEVGRITDTKPKLNNDEKELINMKLLYIKDHYNEEIMVKYFVKDLKKDGGRIEYKKGFVKMIDEYEKVLKFRDNLKISISDIIEIRSDNLDLIFSSFGI